MAQTRHLNHISQLCMWVSRRAIREGVRDTLKGEVCAVSSYEHLDWRTINFTTQGDLHWPTELGELTRWPLYDAAHDSPSIRTALSASQTSNCQATPQKTKTPIPKHHLQPPLPLH